MPLFIADDDLAAHSSDASYVATKADDFIRSLQAELDSVRAAADAAAITAEQTCSLLEHKFLSLSADSSKVQSENAQLQSSLDDRLSQLAQLQAQKHELHLHSIGKDGEIERLTMEMSEMHKSKSQLIELLEQKDLEISEKNATITSYLDKIVNLTDRAAHKEVRLAEIEAELSRSQGNCARLSQEKELIQRHNAWLNDELTSKVDELIELRKNHVDLEEDVSAKLADTERQLSECSSSLKWNMERVKELETKLTSVQEELFSSKDAAAANEERLTAELSTVNKLVELYKESSDEWSQKARELDGAIKALESQLSQVENDYRERLEKEVSARKQLEKEVADLKDKLQSCEAEVESSRKANELNLLQIGSFSTERWTNGSIEESSTLVPRIPVGVSGTALAASLLRDGWSLGKMYAKYQEAVDALRHEQLGRKESEAVLQRVLCELEEKAGMILDERAEYERMVESYSLINQKLQHSISEQANLEKTIQELQVALRRHEREYSLAQKEIVDLGKQVTVLLKECRDIQLRCGSAEPDQAGDCTETAAVELDIGFDAEKVISERLLTFRDINGLVEQNVQLRSLVRTLSDQIQNSEMDFKNKLEMELKKHTDEAASKVAAVLQRAEEQGRMIESLHTSVAMYKRLYEEEHRLHSSHSHSSDAIAVVEDGRKDFLALLEGSQEASKKAQERAAERLRSLEEDLGKSRSNIVSLRSECEKLALDAKFANERLDSFRKEYDHQRNEITSIRARNVELSQLIVEYERKLRENSETLQASEERSRKLSMEASVLKLEKDMLSNAEKRACDEVRSLSERVYRLQASLDTLQSAEEVREEARAAEKRKQEEYIRQVEREWAEAKKELQQERNNVRGLSSDRDRTLKNTMRQVEEMAKELANALHAVSAAETRASVAEAKLSDLEKKIKTSDFKVANIDDGGTCSSVTPTEVVTDLVMAKEEIKKLKAEAQANKDHMMQYKGIAQVNEALLKQMEVAHENFKVESEKLKESLEVELCSLRDEIVKLEKELSLKSEEVASASAGKEEALTTTFAEITSLKEESSRKTSQILAMEIQVSVLKEDLEKEHEQWQVAKANYERQVVLQSETIKELAKTSQALTSLQQEASDLRKLTDTQKSEIVELKTKWEVDKSLLEDSKKEAEKKYDELNEQNKILHSRLEALHIHLAEKDRSSAGISSGSSPDLLGDAGLQNVVNYLRRSKEIAETEISLLKQEKMRLQSQLESALKAAETAQASIRAERANLRPLLFSEEEIKSLQLQVREMNLLRESNMQLREENKHNFEECQKSRQEAQKARMHSDSLESLVREREIEIEACKKGIEMERVEKDHLEKRISELLERCQNIDLQDYDRMKDIVHKLQEKLKEMDDEIGGNKNLLSKQQETISKLEQDLAKSESELNQREKMINDVLQNEATLKSELDKHKKLAIQWKKKADNWLKERDESSKEKQDLSKQIEELKQGKRSTGNIMGEQVIKEKEEKEHRIQILEKTVERQREALRKEKEDHRTEKAKHQNTEKAILDSVKNVDQVKTDFANKLETHKQALTHLADELEKLKHAKSILPEGTQVLQSLSGTTLDDLAAAYESAVENFEKAAHSISIELGQASSEIPMPEHSAPVARGQAAASQSTIMSSVGPATSDSAARVAEEKERRNHVTKAKVETRKTGRKLVRPQLIKPEEPQGDVDMSETDGSSTVEKLATTLESETQRSSMLSQPLARKREASSASEFDEQFHNHGETSSDAAPHIMKRAKVSDSPQEGTEGQTGSPSESLVSLPAVEEHPDDVGHLLQGMNEEGVPEKEEVVTTGEKVEPQKESELLETTNQREPETDKNDVEEILESLSVSVVELEEGSKGQASEDNQQSTLEHESEREEGELLPDVAEVEEGADASNIAGSPERDALPDICTTPAASPARVDEAVAAAGMELGETNFPEVVVDEKNDEGDVVEEGAEGSDKSNDDIEPNVAGTYQVQEIASVSVGSATISVQAEPDASKQASSSTTEADEVKQVSPASSTSRVVNLTERARARAMLRQSGAEIFSSPGSRGRGRPARGRGVRGGRGGRGGRGQAPGQQG